MTKNLALALAACAAGAFLAARAESQQAPVPTQVGTVDVRRVMTEYKRREQVEQALKAKADQLDKEFSQAREALEQKASKLQGMPRDSDEYAQLDREIGIEMQRVKADGEWNRKRLDRDLSSRMCGVYNEICTEVRLQAEMRKLAAVVVSRPLPTGWERNGDIDAVLASRPILYADPALDLTQSVIDSLNAKLPK